MDQADQEKKPGFFKRLFRPSARWSIFSLICVGILIGLVGVIGFEFSMKKSSSEEFCSTSCHEMYDNLHKSLKQTVHYHNRTGVRADCSACHIPKPFIPKMIRKVQAAREVWGHWTGVIDTPEKYAAHQPEMKAREIARLRANDSAECRNCHKIDRMILSLQRAAAQQYHQTLIKGKRTCIDCHQGIAHPLVQGKVAEPEEDIEEVNETIIEPEQTEPTPEAAQQG